MNAILTELETRLSEGGRYYRTFLRPALAEGISALDIDDQLHLFQLFFEDEPYTDDDRLLSERLACSIPAMRAMRQRAIDALRMAINDRTGLRLAPKQVIGVLLTAGDGARIGQSLDLIYEQTPIDNISIATAAVVIQFIVTAGFLSARMAARLNSRPYRVNRIELLPPSKAGEGAIHRRTSGEKRTPERVALKRVTAAQGSASMLFDAMRRLYLEISFQDGSIGAPSLHIAWPDLMTGNTIPLKSNDNALESYQAQACIGYLDSRDQFVLRAGENEIHFEDPHAPIAFSCIATPTDEN